MLKNLVSFSLIIFIAAVVLIIGVGVFMNKNSENVGGANVLQQIAANNLITQAQLTSHNNAADCWLSVSGKVYSVTDYLDMHPGGPGLITPYCGKDATAAFDNRNGRGPHSPRAQSILDNYYVGDLQK